jgi:hypothetical protein
MYIFVSFGHFTMSKCRHMAWLLPPYILCQIFQVSGLEKPNGNWRSLHRGFCIVIVGVIGVEIYLIAKGW